MEVFITKELSLFANALFSLYVNALFVDMNYSFEVNKHCRMTMLLDVLEDMVYHRHHSF